MTVFANIFEMLAENQTTVSANTFGDAEGNDKANIETSSSPVISQIIPAKTWQTAVSHYTKATWKAEKSSAKTCHSDQHPCSLLNQLILNSTHLFWFFMVFPLCLYINHTQPTIP